MTETGELSRMVRSDALPAKPVSIEASEAEMRALAGRFGLPAIHALEAEVTLEPDGEKVRATGRLTARFDQFCAVSGEPFANGVDEALALVFVPARGGPVSPDEEIELEAEELDEIEFEGQSIDLGEAIAQSLSLAIDPYAEGPDAQTARIEAGLADEAASGPFAALAALKKD